MNIFGIGLPEMGLIMIVALLVFGPKKLPEVGRGVAKTINEFKKASKDFELELKKEVDSVEKSVVEPMKATLEKPRALAPDSGDTASSNTASSKLEPTEATIVDATNIPEVPLDSSDAPAADNTTEAA